MNTQFVATLTVEELRTIISEEVQKKISENTPALPEIFLSPKETSSLLGISLQTLTNYTKKGKINDYRIEGSRAVRYKKSEIMLALVSFKKYKSCRAA